MEQTSIKTALSEHLLRAGRRAHAIILWGGNEASRTAFALQLAGATLCSGDQPPCGSCSHCLKVARGIHPDIILLDRREDARGIQVDQIRALKEDAVVLPNEADTKVYILQHADTMRQEAQNAILKLLEEPPESARFLLVAENPAELLTTVRSRCTEIACPDMAIPQGDTKARDMAAHFMEALLSDALALTAFSFALEKLDKSSFVDFITEAKALLEKALRDAATTGTLRPYIGRFIKAADTLTRARDYFDNNVGLTHIAGMLSAELLDI